MKYRRGPVRLIPPPGVKPRVFCSGPSAERTTPEQRRQAENDEFERHWAHIMFRGIQSIFGGERA